MDSRRLLTQRRPPTLPTERTIDTVKAVEKGKGTLYLGDVMRSGGTGGLGYKDAENSTGHCAKVISHKTGVKLLHWTLCSNPASSSTDLGTIFSAHPSETLLVS